MRFSRVADGTRCARRGRSSVMVASSAPCLAPRLSSCPRNAGRHRRLPPTRVLPLPPPSPTALALALDPVMAASLAGLGRLALALVLVVGLTRLPTADAPTLPARTTAAALSRTAYWCLIPCTLATGVSRLVSTAAPGGPGGLARLAAVPLFACAQIAAGFVVGRGLSIFVVTQPVGGVHFVLNRLFDGLWGRRQRRSARRNAADAAVAAATAAAVGAPGLASALASSWGEVDNEGDGVIGAGGWGDASWAEASDSDDDGVGARSNATAAATNATTLPALPGVRALTVLICSFGGLGAGRRPGGAL